MWVLVAAIMKLDKVIIFSNVDNRSAILNVEEKKFDRGFKFYLRIKMSSSSPRQL